VAEGARLESVFTGNRNVGSNPTPSASPQSQVLIYRSFFLARQLGPIFGPNLGGHTPAVSALVVSVGASLRAAGSLRNVCLQS
jgi:hypothetical protein